MTWRVAVRREASSRRLCCSCLSPCTTCPCNPPRRQRQDEDEEDDDQHSINMKMTRKMEMGMETEMEMRDTQHQQRHVSLTKSRPAPETPHNNIHCKHSNNEVSPHSTTPRSSHSDTNPTPHRFNPTPHPAIPQRRLRISRHAATPGRIPGRIRGEEGPGWRGER